jgi:hypothetical protein
VKPTRRISVTGALLLLGSILTCGQSTARGSFATENPWAPEHIEGLPAEIRRGIFARERACGSAAAAGHYFSVSIMAGGRRFVSLHFEDFACANRAAVCHGGGCLHEVYLESRGRHRLVFSVRARDLRMFEDGGAVGLVVTGGKSDRFFRWDGHRFVAAIGQGSRLLPLPLIGHPHSGGPDVVVNGEDFVHRSSFCVPLVELETKLRDAIGSNTVRGHQQHRTSQQVAASGQDGMLPAAFTTLQTLFRNTGLIIDGPGLKITQTA